MRSRGRLPRPHAYWVLAVLPELAWGLLAAGSVTWGWIAPQVLPRADACSDRRTFAVALTAQIALLLGAVILTVVRGVRLGLSGGGIALVAGAIFLPWAGGTLYLWFATGLCWNLTM